MQGKLIIIEAGDGCGKATQAKALYDHLIKAGKKVHKVEFPDYESESSALIKMYLNGKFGEHAEDVNPYAASTFYAVDRYASYKTKWKKWYDEGDIIIADRYTTSNMVHQAVKIEDKAERIAYLEWLWDLEFVKMGLPVPDVVIFLEMSPTFSEKLINATADLTQIEKDIHEKDQAYLKKCYAAYCQLADKYGWHTIHCVENLSLKNKEVIHKEIYQIIEKNIF